MRKFIFTKFVFFIIIFCLLLNCEKDKNQPNSDLTIDSIWEYEPGEYNRMTLILYKNGKLIDENTNSNEKHEAEWKYNLLHTQIIITFAQDKKYWDDVFRQKNYINQEITKGNIGYYNNDKREIIYIIHEDSGKENKYITYLGFNFYKK